MQNKIKILFSLWVLLWASSCWPQKEVLTGYWPQRFPVAPLGKNSEHNPSSSICSSVFIPGMKPVEIAVAAYAMQKKCKLSEEEIIEQAGLIF